MLFSPPDNASNSTNFSGHLRWAVILTVLVNAAAMLSPIINSGDAITYAAIAQHIAQSHDWASLVLDGQDWLDKPHLPFWLTALFFKIGGAGAASYILPGFLFHLIGAYFTYRLARMLFDKQAALLALLVYVSVFNLMDSGIEIKAEAYLRGEIMAASYYWLRYDQAFRLKHLLLGALFTALAIMTKGIFTLFTIFSGLLCLWLYQRQWLRIFSLKWLAALALSLLLMTPELIALYMQFNRHTTGGAPVNAIKFFFWDSQFGRFLNTGPIQNQDGNPFFYVGVFLWGFFPWTVMFFAAVRTHYGAFGKASRSERAALVYLAAAFLCTFMMFSATKYQMGYYIDIILPFAAILCGRFLASHAIGRPLFIAQMCLIYSFVLLVLALSLYVMNPVLLATMGAGFGGLVYYCLATRKSSLGFRAITRSVLSMNLVYGFLVLLTCLAFTRYAAAYVAAAWLGKQAELPVYVYQMPEVGRELALYNPAPCREIESAEALSRLRGNAYLLIRHEQVAQLNLDPAQFRPLASMQVAVHKTGTFNKLLQLAKGVRPLETLDVLQYTAH
jgi:4-amino-4-deoxy-L-arabinose transferase-like glycosyltransferase